MTTLRDAAMKSKAWPFEEARAILKRYEKKAPEKGHVLFETGYGPSGLPDRHAEALAALAAGDAAGVARAMAADIADGVGLVHQALEAGQV